MHNRCKIAIWSKNYRSEKIGATLEIYGFKNAMMDRWGRDVIIYQRGEKVGKGGGGGGGIEEASTTCRNPESIRRTTTDERRNFDRLSRAFRGQSFGQVKLFGRARGTRIMDPNRRLLSSTSSPPPPTLIPRVFSIKLRDPSHQTHHSQTHVP